MLQPVMGAKLMQYSCRVENPIVDVIQESSYKDVETTVGGDMTLK